MVFHQGFEQVGGRDVLGGSLEIQLVAERSVLRHGDRWRFAGLALLPLDALLAGVAFLALFALRPGVASIALGPIGPCSPLGPCSARGPFGLIGPVGPWIVT